MSGSLGHPVGRALVLSSATLVPESDAAEIAWHSPRLPRPVLVLM